MRRSIRGLVATVLLATVLLGGCGGDGEAATIAWTDQLCRALSGFVESVTTRPTSDPTDPEATVVALSEFLAAAETAAGQSLRELDDVGAAPLQGGDAVVEQLERNLTRVQGSFAAVRANLAAADTSDEASLRASLETAAAPLQELGADLNPAAALDSDDAVRAATEQAPHCLAIRRSAGG